MKKPWTALWDVAFKKADGNYRIVWNIYTHLFLMHHQNADEIVVAKDGTPLEARYKCGDMSDKIETEWDKQKALIPVGVDHAD